MTNNEYSIYLKVKHELLIEDVRYFIIDYLAEKRDCEPEDITDDELKEYDYEYLISKYEDKENYIFNDVWNNIIGDYLEEF